MTIANLCQSTKHSSHRLVVKSFRTVDDNHIHPEGLPQIFDCLRFASTSRTFWTTPSMEMESSGQGDVTTVWVG